MIKSLLKLSIYMVLTKLGMCESTAKPPHIVFILADDLGWNDVSFHGSDQIPTPNIDALAYSGVILNQHYTEALCTPSRAAFLTGKYPVHNGMQHNVILELEPWGLPLSETTLPQHLQKLDYETHAIGKWHLGYFKKQYTPIHRGFKSHYGFWNGYQDYYNHTVQASFANYEGYDMRLNDIIRWEDVGHYSTDLFTEQAINIINNHNKTKPLFLYFAHLAPHAANHEEPLQAPKQYIDKFKYILDPERRIYAGMVAKLDESVGKVISALQKAHMLNDSIIVFVSDNGAATKGLHKNSGSNWPLKGEKGTPWEGALRTVGLIWSSSLINRHSVSEQLMHICDWLPTLYSAAGGKVDDLGNIDGVDQWKPIVTGSHSRRHEILHNIDDNTGYAAIRVGNLKYVNGTTLLGCLDDWSGIQRNPRDMSVPKYNVSSVIESDVSKSLVNIGYDLLKLDIIKKLRATSKIVCKNSNKTNQCSPFKFPCIFDISLDPCEKNNIHNKLLGTKIIDDLENRINRFRKSAVDPNNIRLDPNADPKLHNNTWVSWRDL